MARKKLNIVAKLTDAAALGLGATGANVVSNLVPVENSLIKNAAPVALGIFLGDSKSGLIKNAATGMAAVGMSNIISSFLPAGLAGIGNADLYSSVLAGPGDDSPLAGDGEDEGYAS